MDKQQCQQHFCASAAAVAGGIVFSGGPSNCTAHFGKKKYLRNISREYIQNVENMCTWMTYFGQQSLWLLKTQELRQWLKQGGGRWLCSHVLHLKTILRASGKSNRGVTGVSVWGKLLTDFASFPCAGAFLFCWTPFFVLHTMRARCQDCHVPPALMSVVTWLGYVNSALNPVIYTIFNTEFRNFFKKFLHRCCFKSAGWERCCCMDSF